MRIEPDRDGYQQHYWTGDHQPDDTGGEIDGPLRDQRQGRAAEAVGKHEPAWLDGLQPDTPGESGNGRVRVVDPDSLHTQSHQLANRQDISSILECDDDPRDVVLFYDRLELAIGRTQYRKPADRPAAFFQLTQIDEPRHTKVQVAAFLQFGRHAAAERFSADDENSLH